MKEASFVREFAPLLRPRLSAWDRPYPQWAPLAKGWHGFGVGAMAAWDWLVETWAAFRADSHPSACCSNRGF